MSEQLIWEKIKQKVSIPDLVSLERDRCECLIYGNTSSPSEYYNKDTDTLYCHKCQTIKDVIEVYAIQNNIDRKTAIKEMAKKYNIPYEKRDEKYVKRLEQIEQMFEDFTNKCHDHDKFQKHYFFLTMKKRGFTEETIKTHKIGYFDDSIKKYMETKYDKKLLQDAGFVNEKENWSFAKRIVFPYFDYNNKPIYFIYRRIDTDKDFNDKAKYIKQITTKYVKNVLFGLHSLKRKKNENNDILIITEGMTDAISVIQTGYSCLSAVTVRIQKEDIAKAVQHCKRFKKTIIINDNDENTEGLKGAITSLKVLLKNNIDTYIGFIPNPEHLESVDLNDILKSENLEKLQNKQIKMEIENSLSKNKAKLDSLIENSIEGFEFLINTLSKKSNQKDIKEILEIIPEDITVKNRILKQIKEKTELPLSDIKKLFDITKTKPLENQKERISEEREAKKDTNTQIDETSKIVQESDDTTYEVISNKKGLFLRKTTVKYSESKGDYYTKTNNTTIINVPFRLIAIYCDQNQERRYKVKIGEGSEKTGEEIVCRNKKDLLDYIDKKNYSPAPERMLKECVSAILFEYETKYKLIPKEIYPTLGVFLDENDDLIVVTPNNNQTEIYGVNAYQERTIERCKKRGFDANGEQIKEFYDLMHYKTYPENIRLLTFGHSLMVNFFNVLRNDIDIFFFHFWITPNKSVGKTALFKLVYAELFGIELKSNDDIDSIARFSENCTDTTSCMPIDDIDKVDEKVMSQMKVAGTTLKAKERMTKDQKTNIQETFRAFSGTANSDKFLAGDENEAFRGRCMISTEYTIIESFDLLKELEVIRDKIKEGKVFGYYLLNKALEFVNKQIPDTTISSHQKLKHIIRNNKEKLRVYFEKRVLLDDPRRLTIYALLYTGWEMWNFAFQEAKLEKSVLLEEILSFKKNDKLLHLIETYEKIGFEITLDDMRNILEFYDREKENKESKIFQYENTEGKKIVSTVFINEYDKWAKIHGYSVLEKLPILGNMLSKIMKERIVPTTIKCRFVGCSEAPCNKMIRGLIFDEEKLYLKIGKKEPDKNKDTIESNITIPKPERINLCDNLTEAEITGSINLEKVLIHEDETNLKDEIFEICEKADFEWVERRDIVRILRMNKYNEKTIKKEINGLIELGELESDDTSALVRWIR